MGVSKLTYNLSDAQIEIRARKMGMEYKDQMKVKIENNEVEK